MSLSEAGALYRDLSADIRVPELAAFLRSVLRADSLSAAVTARVTLHHQGLFADDMLAEAGVPQALGPEICAVKVVPNATLEAEVRRVGLALQGRLLEYASRQVGQQRYLVLAHRGGLGRGAPLTGSMLFLLGKAG